MTKPYRLARTDKPGVYAVIVRNQVEPIGTLEKGRLSGALKRGSFRTAGAGEVVWYLNDDRGILAERRDTRAEAAEALYQRWYAVELKKLHAELKASRP